MEIQEIKQRLTMAQVLAKYGLKPDKHMRMNCPFHEDKTPSLQVYYKTHTAYCFSSNCPTHGKSLDVIDFIMYQEKCTKHEAILKAQDFIGIPNPITPQPTATARLHRVVCNPNLKNPKFDESINHIYRKSQQPLSFQFKEFVVNNPEPNNFQTINPEPPPCFRTIVSCGM